MNLKNVYVTETAARLANRREVVQVLGAGLVVVVVEPLGAYKKKMTSPVPSGLWCALRWQPMAW